MRRIVGIGILIAGVILAYYGFQESESIAGQAEEVITGSPSDRSMGMIIGGVVLAAAGLGLTAYPGRKGAA
ncbi:MAG: DUF3185 family protein [Verrucomicrobia bacterium]|nr:DUF3185 family protein [Verrucomicrobiota bacterium]